MLGGIVYVFSLVDLVIFMVNVVSDLINARANLRFRVIAANL